MHFMGQEGCGVEVGGVIRRLRGGKAKLRCQVMFMQSSPINSHFQGWVSHNSLVKFHSN